MQFGSSFLVFSISLHSTLNDQPQSHSLCPISPQPTHAAIFSITLHILSRIRAAGFAVRLQAVTRYSSPFLKAIPATRPTQPPIQWLSHDISPMITRPGRESDRSPTSVKVKNEWSFAYTPFVLWKVPSSPFSAFPLTIIRSQHPIRKTGIWAGHFRKHTSTVSDVKTWALYFRAEFYCTRLKLVRPIFVTQTLAQFSTSAQEIANKFLWTVKCLQTTARVIDEITWRQATPTHSTAVLHRRFEITPLYFRRYQLLSYTDGSKSLLCIFVGNRLLIWRHNELKSERHCDRERVGVAQ
jgi:hypothetical protein